MKGLGFMDVVATLCFGGAIFHTFSVKKFQQIAGRHLAGSVGENFFHLLGEVEVVFGLWAAFFLMVLVLNQGFQSMVGYLQNQNFTEPAFVFVMMTVCSTRPVLRLASQWIEVISKLLPFRRPLAFYVTTLIIGPLLGSLITEVAAMTVTALILLERFYQRGISAKLKYSTLGLLFVNISVGGTLTPYAAPPLLMVATQWKWGLGFVLSHFGWRAILAVVLSTALIAFRFRRELNEISIEESVVSQRRIPLWVGVIHLLFVVVIVASAHYLVLFFGIFLFFLGLAAVTQEYQDELKLREGLLVGFFLGGLVVLGGPQRWWLEPLLMRLNHVSLFFGSLALTSITDNAALTYLGSQVPSLSAASRYALVAGAVTGGGLTVIANAPNPAGYGILNPAFGEEGMNPILLLTHALLPTLIAVLCFW